jgi:hypothetical protein
MAELNTVEREQSRPRACCSTRDNRGELRPSGIGPWCARHSCDRSPGRAQTVVHGSEGRRGS